MPLKKIGRRIKELALKIGRKFSPEHTMLRALLMEELAKHGVKEEPIGLLRLSSAELRDRIALLKEMREIHGVTLRDLVREGAIAEDTVAGYIAADLYPEKGLEWRAANRLIYDPDLVREWLERSKKGKAISQKLLQEYRSGYLQRLLQAARRTFGEKLKFEGKVYYIGEIERAIEEGYGYRYLHVINHLRSLLPHRTGKAGAPRQNVRFLRDFFAAMPGRGTEEIRELTPQAASEALHGYLDEAARVLREYIDYADKQERENIFNMLRTIVGIKRKEKFRKVFEDELRKRIMRMAGKEKVYLPESLVEKAMRAAVSKVIKEKVKTGGAMNWRTLAYELAENLEEELQELKEMGHLRT